MRESFNAAADVAVIGGGPAGCATALSLRLSFPQMSVAVLEAGDYSRPKAGEILPSAAGSLLRHLGVLGSLKETMAIGSSAVISAWGEPRLTENPALFSANGGGWHLNRNRFDAMLARRAEECGVRVICRATVYGARREGGAWLLETSGGAVGARVVVDATGRAAGFARMRGVRMQFQDRLTSYTGFATGSNVDRTEVLIEAAPEGWWYTAPVPGGRRVVSYMTDADLGREAGLPSMSAWRKLLDGTEHVRAAVGGGAVAEECQVRAAATSKLERVHGEGWLATGDASAAYDPLAAQGITKALRNGILASYAARDMLLGRETEAGERYSSILDRQFTAYRQAHRRHFAEERRWGNSLFWARRQEVRQAAGAG